MHSIPRRLSWILALLLGLAAGGLARAWWSTPTNWPAARLIQNLERFLESHPDDVPALYTLGRIQGYVFAFDTDSVAGHDTFGTAPKAGSDEEIALVVKRLASLGWQKKGRSDPRPHYPESPPAERVAHLEQAVRTLQRARDLAPGRADIHLGLAWTLEAGAAFAGAVDGAKFVTPLEKQAPQPALDEHAWLVHAAASYRRAFELARETDAALEEQPMDNPFDEENALDSLVSYEAGQALLQLAGRGVEIDATFRTAVEAQLKALEAKPPSKWMTPIVLALEDCRTLDELVEFVEHAHASVPFDLDGDGLDEPWPWLAPGAGWLVWDPEHAGTITSGCQFFGDRSGWFFFRDGYRVLDALDDDGSGELRGAELAGIAVWFDRDSDGVSDRGEVIPVEALGIVALATEATERIGRSLGNPCGVELADGRVLPTYDWVLAPVQAP